MNEIPVKSNIFDPVDFADYKEEIFENIFNGKNYAVERIVSNCKVSRKDQWYDQENDEWVLLLKGFAILQFSNGQKLEMNPGDYVTIPAHVRHKVVKTSDKTDTFWLAIHERG